MTISTMMVHTVNFIGGRATYSFLLGLPEEVMGSGETKQESLLELKKRIKQLKHRLSEIETEISQEIAIEDE